MGHRLAEAVLAAIVCAAFTSAFDPPKFKGYHYHKFTDKFNKNNLSVRLQKLNVSDKKFAKPTLCPPFMEFSNCMCEQTCDIIKPKCGDCTPGCVCRDGFVRNDANKCILPEECPQAKISSINKRISMTPQKLYQAVPIASNATESSTTSTVDTSTTEDVPTTTMATTSMLQEEQTTPSILILGRAGPTPPSGPPVFRPPGSQTEMIGAPSATPPPDFNYGPPGMNAARYQQLENYNKRRRVLKALRARSLRLRSKI